MPFLPWLVGSIGALLRNVGKSSWVFLGTLLASLTSKLKSGSIIQIMYFLGYLLLIGIIFTFIGSVIYYTFQVGLIFYEAFFFIMNFLGYHNYTMGLFFVLLGGNLIISLIKFFKSLFS